ncbi:MAG: Hsp70 family protein, partial [Planctomycetia bacterium]|nr:Hsp70 family protein [Planctomycetia bacterium]
GGTFDVSIVRMESGVVEVLASHGDTHLGGDDFDQLLFNKVRESFQKKNKFDLSVNPVSKSRVIRAVEQAKIQLSTEPFAQIEEEFIGEKGDKPLHLKMEIDRLEYNSLIYPLLEKTLDCLERALTDAHLNVIDIDRLILVGGASRTPLVRSLLESRFQKSIHEEVDPDLCVALGAAIQGALIDGNDAGPILVEITPHTLGVASFDPDLQKQIFSPLIRRNTAIPCSRSEVFVTHSDNQSIVDIQVYQGESQELSQDFLVGKYQLCGLSKQKAGNEIICRFELDLNGMLKITTTEKVTGKSETMVMENALDSRQGNQKTDELDIEFTRVDLESTQEQSEQSEASKAPVSDLSKRASALVKKGKKLAQQATGDDLAEINALLKQVQDAMQKKNIKALESLTDNLDDLIYYISSRNE